MVEGLKKFTKHFEGLEDAYVLIGGAACDMWLAERALPFRATKDLDVVIIIEALSGTSGVAEKKRFSESGRFRHHSAGTKRVAVIEEIGYFSISSRG